MPSRNIEAVLVGHTGFVGSQLATRMRPGLCVHRENLNDLRGVSAQTLYLSALPAQKWWANLHPQDDLDNMRLLQRALEGVRASQVVLVSTVDVYAEPSNVDESTPVDAVSASPYGRHRFEFECWVTERFRRCLILRLPGLFGRGLRKNALFDLLHDHDVDKLHPLGEFQWYPIERLVDDIEQALRLELPLVHAAVAPMQTLDLVRRHFPGAQQRLAGSGRPPRYSMRSLHAESFGGGDGYWMHQAEVDVALTRWVEDHRAAEGGVRRAGA